MHRLRLLAMLAPAFLVGCKPTYSVVKSDFGDSEYASFNEQHCRVDIVDICVETDVALDEVTIRLLVDTAQPRHTKTGAVIAVRMNEHLSDFHKLPTVEVVSGSYSWTGDGIPWGGAEQVSIFIWQDGEWKYIETVERIIDPV